MTSDGLILFLIFNCLFINGMDLVESSIIKKEHQPMVKHNNSTSNYVCMWDPLSTHCCGNGCDGPYGPICTGCAYCQTWPHCHDGTYRCPWVPKLGCCSGKNCLHNTKTDECKGCDYCYANPDTCEGKAKCPDASDGVKCCGGGCDEDCICDYCYPTPECKPDSNKSNLNLTEKSK